MIDGSAVAGVPARDPALAGPRCHDRRLQFIQIWTTARRAALPQDPRCARSRSELATIPGQHGPRRAVAEAGVARQRSPRRARSTSSSALPDHGLTMGDGQVAPGIVLPLCPADKLTGADPDGRTRAIEPRQLSMDSRRSVKFSFGSAPSTPELNHFFHALCQNG